MRKKKMNFVFWFFAFYLGQEKVEIMGQIFY